MRVVFMGTPNFSVPILEALIKEYEVVLVVTQPDKETGRKKILTPSPIKEVALNNNIEVLVYNENNITKDLTIIKGASITEDNVELKKARSRKKKFQF